MQWASLAEERCPIARFLSVMGDRWTLLVLRQVFRGSQRFEEIRRDLEISPTILNQRLKVLCEHAILQRVADPAKPRRPEYHLTAKGLELGLVLLPVMYWGEKYYPSPGGSEYALEHTACGHEFSPVPRVECSECAEPVPLGEVRLFPRESDNP